MKFTTLVKIVTALAAVVGAIYIVATYGDKIVEWAKKIMGSCCSKSVTDMPAPEATAEDFAPVEEPVTEEVLAEVQEPTETQEPAVEVAAESVLADDTIPVADEEDFEG